MTKVFLFVIFLFILNPAFAYGLDFEWKNSQTASYDISVDNEDWYTIRLWPEAHYYLPAFNKELKLCPFIETRYHFHSHKLCRSEFGFEAGTDLFKWLYWAESLQYAILHPGRDTIELESILRFHHPFWIKDKKIEAYIFNEHTFAFVIGEGKRNEIGLGINWLAEDDIELLLGWRHIDRIHNYDSDQIEASLFFSF